MKILNVVGARPNFVKMSPILRAMCKDPGLQPVLVHTGQHYDKEMSEVFFRDLQMSEPVAQLKVGSGSHTQQIARIMVEFEKVCIKLDPDLILVVGDVNSTLACSLVGSKLHIPVAHVEAGLRSRDRTMPEEVNRIVTDAISDILFVPSPDAVENLLAEGIAEERIHSVGNVMVDSLVTNLPAASRIYEQKLRKEFPPRAFGLITLHRPSNVDVPAQFAALMEVLGELSDRLPLLFPVHPRTKKQIKEVSRIRSGVHLVKPLGYLEFLGLLANASIVVTDSGGIQEETSYLNIPCVTVRDNTERPITVSLGSNILAGTEPQHVFQTCIGQLDNPKKSEPIPLWDGRTAERVVSVLSEFGPPTPRNF